MHLIGQYLRPYVKRMSGGMVIKFIGTVMDLLLPYILAYVIDHIAPQHDRHQVVFWGRLWQFVPFSHLLLMFLPTGWPRPWRGM